MAAQRSVGRAEAAGGNGGYGENVKDVTMIQRTGNVRNSAPLAPLAALFAAYEAVNAACDRAHERDDQHAGSLLHHRAGVLAQLTAPQNGGAR